MKKQMLSIALALVLCLSLTVPVFAAKDVSGNQIDISWHDGSNLVLKGVVDQKYDKRTGCYFFDVAVGGSLVLDLEFPKGHNRCYGLRMGGFYINIDHMSEPEGMGDGYWDLPAGKEPDQDQYVESDGKRQYVYNFTEAEMGKKNGFDKVIAFDLYWMDDLNGNGMYEDDVEGEAEFYVRVVPAESAIPSTGTAYASTQGVDVDGKTIEFPCYALKDANGNDTNYMMLRDVAHVLRGTDAQFSVGWDGPASTITATSGGIYQNVGSEMNTPFSGNRTYTVSTSKLTVNGKIVDVTAILLKDDKGGGYTYFKLRDLGKELNFNVSWIDGGIVINTDQPYSDAN